MSRKAVAEKFRNEAYDIAVTGRHVTITDVMKDYAIDKVSKIDRFSNRVIDVNVIMDIQKLEQRVDIIMKVDHIVIKASASSDNMYASIDKAVDRLTTQLRRYKSRIRDHQLKGGSVIDMNVKVLEAADENLAEVNDDIDSVTSEKLVEQYRPHKIVSQETLPLKKLNYHEAVMKMELSGDIFMVFRSEEDHKLKVIYRRNDGNFGIIEPEK